MHFKTPSRSLFPVTTPLLHLGHPRPSNGPLLSESHRSTPSQTLNTSAITPASTSTPVRSNPNETSSDTTVLDEILGKYKKARRSVSWAQDCTYHFYHPWQHDDTTGTTSSRPIPVPSGPTYNRDPADTVLPNISLRPTLHPTTTDDTVLSNTLPRPATRTPTSSITTGDIVITTTSLTTTEDSQLPPTTQKIHTHVPWPPNITAIIKQIIEQECPAPSPTAFTFQLSQEAAHRNFCVLQQFGGDLGRAIAAQSSSPLGYGSEFRPRHLLSPLLQYHPYWEKFESLLTHGSDWPLANIDDGSRAKDVSEALEFGNHKRATENPDLLTSLILDDVIHGFTLPLPLHKITRLRGILLSPMNIATQDTIDGEGNVVPKDRLTHDQSYIFNGSGTSVNSRVDKSQLTPCIFGWVIRRLVNWIVAARRKHPQRRIYATKLDFKAAYRRLHLNHRISIQSCTQLPDIDIALLWLRLTFGGAPCPYEWSIISELICDLATAILTDDEWDPTELLSPDQDKVPAPTFLPDDIPFGEGKELVVDLDIDVRGTHEMYLDDLIGLGIDLPNTDNTIRSERAPLLGIHTCARPIHPNEPIPRQNVASLNKLKAEGGLSEVKNILGWTWDLRRLIISLPNNKHVAWSESLKKIIAAGKITPKDLETTIGRLGHLSLVIPHVHDFLSRLRDLHTRTKHQNRRLTKIPQICIDDLSLMLSFLDYAHRGVDMNIISYRKPTHVYRSDACPAGLGGYSHEGFAWRYYLSPDLLFRASNNLLEHLASVITPWVDVLAGRLHCGDCALSMTDNTTSAGWLRKSNFREIDDDIEQVTARIEVARTHARRYMNHEIRDYSQWFPGIENDVADSLSRDMHLSDTELTQLLLSSFPSQVPHSFHIVPLPNEIVSWMTSLLLTLPVKEQYREPHTPTKIGRGDDGKHTVTRWDLPTTSTSQLSRNHNKRKSSELSHPHYEKDDLRVALQTPWLLQQSEVPSITWSRPSAVTVTETQRKTKTEN